MSCAWVCPPRAIEMPDRLGTSQKGTDTIRLRQRLNASAKAAGKTTAAFARRGRGKWFGAHRLVDIICRQAARPGRSNCEGFHPGKNTTGDGVPRRRLQVITSGASRPVATRIPAICSAAAMIGAKAACVSSSNLSGPSA